MWVTKDAWCLFLSLGHRAQYYWYVVVGVPNSAILFILFIPLQTHPSKLFLRQLKDVRKKTRSPQLPKAVVTVQQPQGDRISYACLQA